MKLRPALISGLIITIASVALLAEAKVGTTAPDFTLSTDQGVEHSLAQYRGSYVVLEWVNLDCPFVKKHYDSKNMQGLQKRFTKEGVVWLSISSSAKGKQGHLRGKELKQRLKKHDVAHTAYLVDTDGKVGKAFGAKTTPHMFVIDPEGVVIYAGAIDNKPSTKKEDVEGADNYVSAALTQALAGEEITTKATKPYGCSVKY